MDGAGVGAAGVEHLIVNQRLAKRNLLLSQQSGALRGVGVTAWVAESPRQPLPPPPPIRQRVEPLGEQFEGGDRPRPLGRSGGELLFEALDIGFQRRNVGFEGGDEGRVGRTYEGAYCGVRFIGEAYARPFVIAKRPRPPVANCPLAHRLDGYPQPCGSLGVGYKLPVHCRHPNVRRLRPYSVMVDALLMPRREAAGRDSRDERPLIV